MEFSTLTRRVAEYSQIDPSDVAADGKNSSGPSSPLPLPGGGLFEFASGGTPDPAQERASLVSTPASGRGGAPGKGDRQDKAGSLKGTPISLSAARAEALRKLPFDRSKYQTIRSLDALKAWLGRVHDVGYLAIEAMSD